MVAATKVSQPKNRPTRQLSPWQFELHESSRKFLFQETQTGVPLELRPVATLLKVRL